MKNLIYLGCAVFVMMACKTKIVEPASPPPPPPAPAHVMASMIIADQLTASTERGVLMKGGNMMIMQDGSFVPMHKDMMLENGDTIKMNGEIIHKDGSITKMQEGMMIDKNGTMTDKDGQKIAPR